MRYKCVISATYSYFTTQRWLLAYANEPDVINVACQAATRSICGAKYCKNNDNTRKSQVLRSVNCF